MELRRYDADKDGQAARRIWRECGWVTKDTDEGAVILAEAGTSWVAEVNGQAECLVTTMPGTMMYLREELPFSCVAGVTTGLAGRKQGLATKLTAKAMAAAAAGGAPLSALGMFEQGFYDRLGFGSGGEEIWVTFDPAQLKVAAPTRPPKRITGDDWQEAHDARRGRMRGHGACSLTSPANTRAEMMDSKKAFGLGYYDGPGGRLSHYFWCEPRNMESGPYCLRWMAYQSGRQFLELMGLLRSLGDQVRSVEMRQPVGIQLQDLLDQPFRFRQLTERSKHAARARAWAYWQVRICDLPTCLAATHLTGPAVRFNLELSDPIGEFLPAESPWRGVAGQYVVTAGPDSSAESGSADGLATLTASVGAFTRLWLGVLPTTGLAITDQLSGPADLLAELDEAFRLPRPSPDWDF